MSPDRHGTPVRGSVAAALAAAVLLSGAVPARGEAPATRSAFADTSRPVKFLQEVVVTGARYPRAYYESPQALSFVSRLQLREQAPAVLGDVLAGVPGVDNSKDSPWEQQPVLRGLSGQRVLVLVDGSPMNNARGRGPQPSLVDPSQVERIEVVRGPSSVAYGSDALGGVINIITREPLFTAPDQRLRGAASLGGSTADRQRHAAIELMPRVGRLAAFLASGARRAEDFDAPSRRVENSSFRDYNALANLRYDFTGHLALKAGYQLYRADKVGIPGLSFVMPGASQDFSFRFYDRDVAHLTLDHAYPESWLASARVKAYWQRERRNFHSRQELTAPVFTAFGVPPRAGAQTAITTQDRFFDLDTYGFQTQITSRRTERFRFAAGVDAARDLTDGDNVRYRTYYDDSGQPLPGPGGAPATGVTVTASVPDGRFDNYGGFVQAEWFVHPQWTASAGGRYTYYRYRTDHGVSAPASGPVPAAYFTPQRVDDDALSGSLGLVYAPLPDLRLSANVASGYRQPNAQDLFFNGPASVGEVRGNPELEPERSVSYDFGLRWGPGDLALSGNLFYSTYRGLIDAVQIGTNPVTRRGIYQYVNIATATIWGGEAEGEWRFRPQWSARATVTGAVGDNTSREAILRLYGVTADRAPLPGVPPFKGTMSLRWRDARGRAWIEPAARYAWRTNRLPPPTPGVPELTEFKKEWLVVDLSAGVRVPSGQRLVAGVRNLGDTEYRQPLGSLDEPGRSFFATLSTEF